MDNYFRCVECHQVLREYILNHYFGGACPLCGRADTMVLMSKEEVDKMHKASPPPPPRLTTKEWNERSCSVEGCVHPPEFRYFVIDPKDNTKMSEKMYCLKHGEEQMRKVKEEHG